VKNLREERLNRGWTLAVAAEKFGCTEGALSMIEREERRPGPTIAFAIAETYGFKVTDQWPVTTAPAEKAA
jgi:transcriptional regulator with XRE-family HTH domain